MKTEKLILIVDDFSDIRDAHARFLASNGFRVAEAGDGHEALEKVSELQPDLVLMDLSLPGIDGWAVTRRLKQDGTTRHIPIVILTAYSAEGARAVIREGCEGFLIKPTAPMDLLREIHRVLARDVELANHSYIPPGKCTHPVP